MPVVVLVVVLVIVVLVLVSGHRADPTRRSLRCDPVILDGHNDLALRVFLGQEPLHIDLATAVDSGFAGGLFALSAPQGSADLPPSAPYSLPLAEPIAHAEAWAAVDAMTRTLHELDVDVVERASEIVAGRVNAIMHFEGAEPIAPDLSDLDAWVDRGLRSVGITWSRPNAFGEGVPFRFPSTPDTGPGLTAAGFDLVHACNFHGLLVDVSHLNEAGFWDVVGISQAPIVATHSNAHALSPSSRNLTDRQLDAIAGSGGVVGINFAVMFLTEDGGWDVSLEAIVRHLDYIASRIGVDHVAFGSDFEGAPIPADLEGVSGLPRLVEAIAAAGYDGAAIAKITHQNWLRVLDDVWKPWSRYYRRAGFDARPTLLAAAERFAEPGLAVDLGAGTGRDTLELLRRGWRVVAIDAEREAVDKIVQLAGPDASRLEAVVGRYESTGWPACDLLNASYAIPFCPPEQFPAVWARIVDSIAPGGRFSGQFFGPNDDWARTGLLIHSRAELEQLLEPFEIESLIEEDADGTTTVGVTKHWHLFHVVARKL
jgi:membrane dipeptidase